MRIFRAALSCGLATSITVALSACGTGSTNDAKGAAAAPGTSTTSLSSTGSAGSATPASAAVSIGGASTESPDALLAQITLSVLTTPLSSNGAENGSTVDTLALNPNCPQVTVNPAPLDPNNLPTQWGITWTYNACGTTGGVTLTGTRSVSVDQQCDMTRDVRADVKLTAAFTGGTEVQIASKTNIAVQGPFPCHDTTRIVDETGTRISAHLGDQNYNVDYTTHLTIVDSTDPKTKVQKQVIRGDGVLTDNLSKEQQVITVNNLTIVDGTCCYPVSGSIELSSIDDSMHGCGETMRGSQNPNSKSVELSYTFGSTCGQVTAKSGDIITLPACN